MKAFHSLMKFAYFINNIIKNSSITSEYVKSFGGRHFIKKVWDILKARGAEIIGAVVTLNCSVGSACRCKYRDLKLIAA
jgi:hypothetical protein